MAVKLKYLLLLVSFFAFSSVAGDEARVIIEKNSPVTQGKALSEDVGIEMWGGTLNPIIFMGCELPCEQNQVFSTADEQQIDMSIKLVRGKSKEVKDGTYLGTYRISGLVPAENGRTTLDVVFGASNGNLWLSAKDIHGLSNIKITKVTR
ncbi:Hsp70 family protein [Vibrio salinus]|uniref:Hsp70 family protein n=1 Tax=Vibrio salinus TaxID=2899784 RepID=UPI001E5486D2|nr:Hsp70 family protein [Vibrio salinus]MCE0495641.1 Hsp70 family protein [Vibrio salinus]